MFEKSLKDCIANIFIDDRIKSILDRHGISQLYNLNLGWNTLSYDNAVSLTHKYYGYRVNVPKYHLKQYDAFFKGIMDAFGPEFWNLHAKR